MFHTIQAIKWEQFCKLCITFLSLQGSALHYDGVSTTYVKYMKIPFFIFYKFWVIT